MANITQYMILISTVENYEKAINERIAEGWLVQDHPVKFQNGNKILVQSLIK